MEKDVSIKVNSISKIYQLYEKPVDRLKEAMSIKRKVYHKKHFALENISFEVAQGETFGIIGTNGAGKSTLLKLITGVATPSTGEIEVDGKISALLELGAGFNKEYTGIENVYLNGTMMGYTREEMKDKVENILDFADIGDFIYQPVKTYSSGMFARLAFAVAINVEPEILIVDEALSVGDVFFQNKCFRKFEELRRKNTTIIFVSHDIGTVKQMCSRVLWIEHGRQQMVGDTIEVCNMYTNSVLKKRGKESNTNNSLNGQSYLEKRRINLNDYPEVYYTNESILNKDIEIISCILEDDNDERVAACQVEENYTLSIIFKTKIDILRCLPGFVIETIKGIWIINCNSENCGARKTFNIKANTLNCINFKFKMPKIVNGDYVVGVAISDGTINDFRTLTWLYNVLYIQITNSDNTSGVLNIDAEVEIYGNEEESDE